MNRQDFVKLLEQYKQKALDNLRKESKVTAALLISDDLKERIQKYESAAQAVNSMLGVIIGEGKNIIKQNNLPDKSHFYYQEVTMRLEEKILDTVSLSIRQTKDYNDKQNEICYKFDSVIKAAKVTRSAAKLKAIADSVGIQIQEIDVTQSISQDIDTDFVKEKIQSVLLLK